MVTQYPPNVPKASAGVSVQDAKHALESAEKDTKDKIGAEDSALTKNLLAANTASDAAQDSGGANLLLDGLNSLVDKLPALAKALDQVAQIHPFVAGVSPVWLWALARAHSDVMDSGGRRVQGRDRTRGDAPQQRQESESTLPRDGTDDVCSAPVRYPMPCHTQRYL